MSAKRIDFSKALEAWRRGDLAIDGSVALSGQGTAGHGPVSAFHGLRPDALLSTGDANAVLAAVGAKDDGIAAALRGAALLALGRGPAASDAFARALDAGVPRAALDTFVSDLFGSWSRALDGQTAGIDDLQAMTAQSRSVVRIEHEDGTFFGSGVLIRGDSLAPRLGPTPVVLTCAHVCCDAPGALPSGWSTPLAPAKARVVFVDGTRRDLPGGGRTARTPIAVTGVAWRSVVADLDACALRIDAPPSWASPLPFSARDPLPNRSRIYLTSFPRGGPVRLSFEDNRPTGFCGGWFEHTLAAAAGSSGGPIFHRADHGVVGLHRGVKEVEGHAVWVGALRQQASRPG